MLPLVKFAIVFLFGFGYVNGQDEGFLGLPVDFDDTFGLEFRNTYFEKEKEDIWDEKDLQPNLSSQDIINKLCEEYDLYLNKETVDCKNIKFVQKALNINEHNINKRDIGDEQEGSGEEGPHIETDLVVEPRNFEEPVPYEETNSEEAENNFAPLTTEAPQEFNKTEEESATALEAEEPAPLETEGSAIVPEGEVPQPTEIPDIEAPTESLNIKEPTILDEIQEATAVPEVEGSTGVPEVDQPQEEEPTSLPEEQEQINSEQTVDVSTLQAIQENDKDEDVLAPTEFITEPKEDIVPIENTEAPLNIIVTEADVLVTETPGIIVEPKEVNIPDETDKQITGSPILETNAATEIATETDSKIAQSKKGRKLIGTNENNQKETENVNDQQSGNAIIDSTGTGSLAESDEAIKKMSANAKIQQSNSEEPKSGESATSTNTSRKDTKILIILFVAVVVVGCAALSYNFIKKRKQKKAEEARAENGGGNSLKKSLQNLSGNTKSDSEQGTELKPLMKNDKPIIEYKDEKQNNTAETNK